MYDSMGVTCLNKAVTPGIKFNTIFSEFLLDFSESYLYNT